MLLAYLLSLYHPFGVILFIAYDTATIMSSLRDFLIHFASGEVERENMLVKEKSYFVLVL